MNNVIDSNDTAKKPAKSPLKDVHDSALVRDVDEGIARKVEPTRRVDDGNGDDGDDGDGPPSSGDRPSRPAFSPPQFAIRIGDGAMLMAVNEHANDRDLTGREVWICFVLTDEEAESARQHMDTAEHEAAVHIAVKLPRKGTH